VAQIELVCPAHRADDAVRAIRENACTDQPGDGIIVVVPVERAVKIRTGEEGPAILQA